MNVDEVHVDRVFESEFMKTMHQKFEDCTKYGYSNTSVVVCIKEMSDETISGISVHLTGILINTCDEDDQEIDFNDEQHITVKLIRYVNGIPLLDSSDINHMNNYTECGIAKAFISLNWKEYGKKISAFETTHTKTQFSKTHFKLSTIYDPSQYNYCTNNCDRNMAFIFLVNIDSRDSLYTSLRKAAIVNQYDLTGRITLCVRVVMDAIKRQLHDTFMNSTEWRVCQLNSRFIPSLSRSIARSINLMHNNPLISESMETIKHLSALSALEINQNDHVSTIASLVSRRLLGIIDQESSDDIETEQEEIIGCEEYGSESDKQED